MNPPAWFVYLFALADCSAFKVGFSCNPLQRIHCFSHRYFERFDLDQSRLRSFAIGVDRMGDAAGYFRAELHTLTRSFEPLAMSQAQQICDAAASPYSARSALTIAGSLRDWLDAYRFFDLPLFSDDPQARQFVSSTARLTPRTLRLQR